MPHWDFTKPPITQSSIILAPTYYTFPARVAPLTRYYQALSVLLDWLEASTLHAAATSDLLIFFILAFGAIYLLPVVISSISQGTTLLSLTSFTMLWAIISFYSTFLLIFSRSFASPILQNHYRPRIAGSKKSLACLLIEAALWAYLAG